MRGCKPVESVRAALEQDPRAARGPPAAPQHPPCQAKLRPPRSPALLDPLPPRPRYGKDREEAVQTCWLVPGGNTFASALVLPAARPQGAPGPGEPIAPPYSCQEPQESETRAHTCIRLTNAPSDGKVSWGIGAFSQCKAHSGCKSVGKNLFPSPMLQEILAQAGVQLGEQPGPRHGLHPSPPSAKRSPAAPGRGAAAPGSLRRAAEPGRAAPAAPASFGPGAPASNPSSFMLSLQTRAQTFNHSS